MVFVKLFEFFVVSSSTAATLFGSFDLAADSLGSPPRFV